MAINLTGRPGAGAPGGRTGIPNLVVGGVLVPGQVIVDPATIAALLRPANGRTRANHVLSLTHNALIERLDVKITAFRADLTRAADVADVRQATGPDGLPGLVVDFGTMRTVGAVLYPRSGGFVERPVDKLFSWLGSQFQEEGTFLSPQGSGVLRSDAAGSYQLSFFPLAETRSERILVQFGNSPDAGELAILAERLEVTLPELPADLLLRINGGPPIWEHSGPVEPGSSAALDDLGWTTEGERLVSLAAALAPFTGDASNPQEREITLELESRVPGRLAITEHAREAKALHRLRFNESDSIEVDFPQEGQQTLDLSVPDNEGQPRPMSGLHLTLSARNGPERVLPPLGPVASGKAELVLGPGRAGCVRLLGGAGLTELIGVRLPLRAGPGGAEVSVMLWRDTDGVPLESLEEAVSEPVTLEGETEGWFSFRFIAAQPFESAAPPWAAVMVNRGEVIWKLADNASEGIARPLRVGPPEGPWRALPAIFGPATTLGPAAGRVRLIGQADEAEPVEPYLIALTGQVDDLAVTPPAGGLRLQLNGLSAEATRLQITSRTPGVLTLTDVDAVTDG